MQIKEIITGRDGKKVAVTYTDVTTEAEFADKKVKAVRGYCFYKDKIVLVREAEGHWGLPGGAVEPGESATQAWIREVKEETNMKVLKMEFICLQEVMTEDGQKNFVRAACIVEPYGDFVKDPAAEITEIDLIEPSEIIARYDAHWGKIGERMLARAIEAKGRLLN